MKNMATLKVLFDVNILQDVVSERPNWEASYLVLQMTRNSADYSTSRIKAATPEEFLDLLT